MVILSRSGERRLAVRSGRAAIDRQVDPGYIVRVGASQNAVAAAMSSGGA
jgi:hypothetical protein